MALIKRKEVTDKVQAIKVFPRVRPMNEAERDCKAHNVVDISDNTISIKNMNSVKKYSFDHVFNWNTSQQEIYSTVVSPMIFEVLNGFSCTVFAYGQTGTGKTFTMAGGSPEQSGWREDKRAGVIPRALAQLFELLEGRESNVRVSYIELYNEEIIDLLSEDDHSTRIRLFDDQKQKGSVLIQGTEEVTVRDKNEVYALLDRGMLKRQTATTLINASSSRSHTVFIITVHTREVSPEGEEMVKVGKLYLVDLAGSENIAKSGATEKRARETAMINQSLLTLGRVIQALVGNNSHVPYRESKLTRILQDSLGGRSKTSLIVTVSPASSNVEESVNTLEYGSRARNIQNRPEVNQRMSKTGLINSYVEEIEKLKKDLAACRTKDGVFMNADNYDLMMAEKRHNADELMKRLNEIKSFEERMELLNSQRHDLQMNFAVTETALEHAQMRLDHCKKDLMKVKKKNKIRDVYIQKVFEIEDRNTNSYTELRNFAQKTYDNECFMHKKMEDCYDVFMRNFERGKSALTDSEVLKSDISDCVRKYMGKINAQANEIVVQVKQQSKHVETHIHDFQLNLNDMVSNLQENTKTISEMMNTLNAGLLDQNSTQTTLHNDLVQHIASLSCHLSEMQGHVASANESVLQLRENNESHLTNARTQFLLNDLTNMCQELIHGVETLTEQRNQSMKTVNDEAITSAFILERGMDMAQEILDSYEKHTETVKNMQKIFNVVLGNCGTQKKLYDQITENSSKELNDWKNNVRSKQNVMTTSILRMQEIHIGEVTDISNINNDIQSALAKGQAVIANTENIINDKISNVVFDGNEIINNFCINSMNIIEERECNIQAIDDTTQTINKKSVDFIENATNFLDTNGIQECTERIPKMGADLLTKVDDKLPKLTDRFEQFITKDMERVNKSGNTPVKAVLKEIPGNKRIPTEVFQILANKVDKYDQNNVDSFLGEENINPDVSMVLDSSLLNLNISISETENAENCSDSSVIALD